VAIDRNNSPSQSEPRTWPKRGVELRMYFSAEASFIVADGTGSIGLAMFNRARSTSLRWLALVPKFFAL